MGGPVIRVLARDVYSSCATNGKKKVQTDLFYSDHDGLPTDGPITTVLHCAVV